MDILIFTIGLVLKGVSEARRRASLRPLNYTLSPSEIPEDIVIEIFECIYNHTLHLEHCDTMLACSLVCKAWTLPAQRILFRVVFTQRTKVLWKHSFINALTRNPHLGTHVRSLHPLHVVTDALQNAYALHGNAVTERQLASILTVCPQLRELCIDFDKSTATMPSLLSYAGRGITHLHIIVTTYSSSPYLLLSMWPSVRFLRLESSVISSPSDRQPPLSLETLQVKSDLPLSADCLRWLLPPSRTARLRRVEIPFPADESSRRAYTEILTSKAPGIRTLTATSNVPPVDAFEGLSSFNLHRVPSAPLTLPLSIEHLGFYPESDEHGRLPLPHLLAAISSIPRLRSFTINDHVSAGNMHDLYRACRRSGVSLRIGSEPGWVLFRVCFELVVAGTADDWSRIFVCRLYVIHRELKQLSAPLTYPSFRRSGMFKVHRRSRLQISSILTPKQLRFITSTPSPISARKVYVFTCPQRLRYCDVGRGCISFYAVGRTWLTYDDPSHAVYRVASYFSSAQLFS
ncbi:hypothetical protein BV25DRAFT_404229 [Artomyces pyxidatus]|uniref:Uncharacterized protein n=1 Tax=Artomyces pyxidatus TaxID=48021 RepID=A0ACB8T4Q7_9AGAM|nr:hypothetical protein BV25DRAFT_404229 [Artomyces pyxidatus]